MPIFFSEPVNRIFAPYAVGTLAVITGACVAGRKANSFYEQVLPYDIGLIASSVLLSAYFSASNVDKNIKFNKHRTEELVTAFKKETGSIVRLGLKVGMIEAVAFSAVMIPIAYIWPNAVK